MIDLFILGSTFQTIDVVDDFYSLVRTRKYYECGNSELQLSIAKIASFRSGAYLYCKSFDELGLLEVVRKERDKKGAQKLIVKGRFAEAILCDRVIESGYTYSGTPETVLRQLVTDYFITPTDMSRARSDIALGDLNGVGTQIDGQIESGKTVYEAACDLCKPQGLSFRLSLDYLNDRLLFSVWQGLDRTSDQEINTPAVFSDDRENITSSEYEENVQDYKNFAYVVGEGDTPITTTVNNVLPGEARRELYVDASGVKREDGVTDAEYIALLQQTGIEKLGQYPRVASIKGDVDAQSNLIYREDYDLGDKCSYIDVADGIQCDDRITAIKEVYEKGKYEVTPTLGVFVK